MILLIDEMIEEEQWNENNSKNIYYEVFDLFCGFGSHVNIDYIRELFMNTDNQFVLYNIDNDTKDVEIKNCPCGIIYQTIQKEEDLNIYIMLMGTKYKFRNYGYATLLLKEWIESIQNQYSNNPCYQNVTIFLESIEKAVTFYEHIGFKWIIEDLSKHELFNFKNDDNEHFIMKYEVK